LLPITRSLFTLYYFVHVAVSIAGGVHQGILQTVGDAQPQAGESNQTATVEGTGLVHPHSAGGAHSQAACVSPLNRAATTDETNIQNIRCNHRPPDQGAGDMGEGGGDANSSDQE
jgi:hypothetical protein